VFGQSASWRNLGRDSTPKLSTRFHALSTSTESCPAMTVPRLTSRNTVSPSRAYHERDRGHVRRDGVAGREKGKGGARDCTTRARSFSRGGRRRRPFSKGQKFIHRQRDTLRSGCSPERFLFTLTRKRAPRVLCVDAAAMRYNVAREIALSRRALFA